MASASVVAPVRWCYPHQAPTARMVDARGRDGDTRARIRCSLVAVYALGVLVASTATPPSGALAPRGPLGLVGIDAWLHLAAYAVLGFGVVAVLPRLCRPRRSLVAIALSTGFGAGVELVQFGLPARAFGSGDLAANAAGATLGVAAWWGYRRIQRGRGTGG